jgi:hypothetical protein
MKFLHVPTFLLSLAIGLFLVYIENPNSNTIFVYPKPDNIDKLLFRDKSDTCFEFHHKIVPCPQDNKKISNYMIQ